MDRADIIPTPEQAAIVDAAVNSPLSLMISADAGCAKTTALELAAWAMPPGPSLALAFGVKNKTELEKRFPPHFTVLTLNGLGHRAWGRACRQTLIVDDRKVGRLLTATAKDQGYALSKEQWSDVRSIVSHAQHLGLVPSDYPHKGLMVDTPESWMDIADALLVTDAEPLLPLARAVLCACIAESFTGLISYDDQIYMSALFNGNFPRFPRVFVDEAQDLSSINHLQIKRTLLDRLIVAGDDKQGIYAWRGADSSSMRSMRMLRKEWLDLRLSVTFRCPRVVVARQQSHAPGFTSAPSCVDGEIWDWAFNHDRWTWATIDPEPKQSVAILCRNNAPLMAIAMKLIRQGVGAVMLGREIGKGLVSLAKKIIPLDSIPASECRRLITQWADDQIEVAAANDKHEKIAGIEDRRDSLLAVLDSGPANSGAMRKALDELFSRASGRVTLSTIHKFKGLESDIVVHLDPWRIPSKWARLALSAGDDRPMQQELNLRYVVETRTRRTLILANLEDFQ